jgi:hypothetical protein
MPDPEIQPPSEFQADVQANGIRQLTQAEKEKIQPTEIAAIERAKRLGTYGAIDRRAQYSGPDRARPEALLQAVNALGNHTRGLQKNYDEMKRAANYRLRNTLAAIALTALLARAPELLSWAARLLR